MSLTKQFSRFTNYNEINMFVLYYFNFIIHMQLFELLNITFMNQYATNLSIFDHRYVCILN